MTAGTDRLISSGIIAFATIDETLRVTELRGELNFWLPEVGQYAHLQGPLFGLEGELYLLRSSTSKLLSIPSIRYADAGGKWQNIPISIQILWDDLSATYTILTCAQNIHQDITASLTQARRGERVAQEQAEAAKVQARDLGTLYQSIVDTSTDFILRLAEDGRITFANAMISQYLNRSPENLLGQRPENILPSQSATNSWSKAMENALSLDRAVLDMELNLAGNETRSFTWAIKWLGEDGPREYQALGRDVTDARDLEIERIRASENALVTAVTHERLRIARELHDTLVRATLSVLAQIRLARKLLKIDQNRTSTELALAEEVAESGVSAARDAIFEMRLELSEDHPLGPSLHLFAGRVSKRTDLKFVVDVHHDASGLSNKCAEALYRIVCEAVRNIELHANAANVELRVTLEEDAHGRVLSGIISDNGVGFDTTSRKEKHYGLSGMEEHARHAGGALEISSSPSQGTTIRVAVPMTSSA